MRTFACVSRVSHAAVGHVVDAEGGNIIDHEPAYFNIVKRIFDQPPIIGKEPGLQPKLAGIDGLNGSVNVTVGIQSNKRPKGFLTRETHVFV